MTLFLIIILSLFFLFIALKNFKLALGLIFLGLPLYLIKVDLFVIKNLLEILILVCAIVFIVKLLKKEILLLKLSFLKDYWWLLVLLFVALVVSILISEDKIRSLGVFKAWFLLPVLFGIMVGVVVKKKKDFLRLIYFFLSASLILSILGLWQFLTGNTLEDGRVGAVFESANYLAMFLGIGLCFIFLINEHKELYQRNLLRIVFVIIFFGFLLTRSQGAFLGFLLAILFGFLLKSKKVSVNFIILLVILALFFQFFGPILFFDEIKSAARNSISTRLQIWYVSFQIFKDHPFLGIGLGQFEAVYQKYLPHFFFPPLEWLSPQPHSLYLAFLLQAGILGLIVFWLILRKVLKNILPSALNDNALTFSILVAILFIIFHGMVDTPYWKNDLAVIFWVLVFGTAAFLRIKAKKAA